MIHLDMNYLIGLLVHGSRPAMEVDQWLAEGEGLAASSIAWSEFLNGPVETPEISRVEAVLQSRVMPFGKVEAALAADLFNQTGRHRGSRFDCLVAATAISNQASLATINRPDFAPFAARGLNLV